MKKALVVILGVVLMSATTSCYKHHVCATYVKAEKKMETPKSEDNI